ncbi:hypothetical protein FH972_026482 [Carpinus fangiana]|uniref:Uncharacterized protein n=1 Tax=Carpinus fangiana TaxID=176857 RepID=A0A5N6L4L2_9ROSI|nr:hypothetical protein FH972_026482 [Carpinus fangiana]
MPAHFRPAPVHYSSEPNWPSAAQAAPLPQEPQMAFDPASLHQPPHRHSYVAPPPQPLHHASYPGYSKPSHQEQVMVHQPQPRYPEQRAFHSSPTPAHQHTYSVPDFSRNYGGQPASTAALRAPQSQARGRPVSMVETPTPSYNNSQQLNPAQPSLGGPSTPRRVLRKSVSPHPAPQTSGTHYSPDSFNTYNTHTSRPTANADTSPSGLREPSPMYTASMPVPESSPDPPASTTRTTPDGRILTSSGKVVDPSDHIPSTSWAPEPEPKGARPSVAIHIKNRFGPREARSLPPSPGATSPAASSPASVGPSPLAGASMRPRHSTLASPIVPSPLPQSNSHPGRNRLQKRIPSNPLAESAPGTLNAAYRAPRAAGAPPIPPKLPLGYANGEFAPANEPFNDALSQEMSLIDIGPKEDSGRRRGLFGRKKKVDEYS